ncbi:hypothetical protein ACFLXA_01575 [Chloroflexota bacterium]
MMALLLLSLIIVGLSCGNDSLHGTYSVSWMGGEWTITFKGETCTRTTTAMGGFSYKFRYQLDFDGDSTDLSDAVGITFTDPATGESSYETFEYIEDMDAIVLDGQLFYKK